MATTIEYALMAGASYYDTRLDINRFPLPQNWSYVSRVPQDLTTGFEASAYINSLTNEIVISYAGTTPNSLLDPDNAANVGLAFGTGSAQLVQAAEYYLQVKALNPNVTLTGHSLGGGLAALVGVFFGVPATTFDQAPFAQTALFKAVDLKNELVGKLDANGVRLYGDAMLAPLTDYINQQQNALPANIIPNSNLVSTIRVDGEFTASLPVGTLFSPIGTSATVLDHGPYSSPSIDMHSQALLTAFLQSQQTAATGQTLSEVTKKLTDLLGMIFDENLFAHPTNDPINVNLLEHLVRHEAGNAPGVATADAMVTRFTTDLWKIAQDGGLTLTDANVANTLTAFAMQMYYENAAAANPSKQLFSDVSGGIRFNREDVASSLSNAKGYTLYFLTYLQENFTASELDGIISALPNIKDWYIQAGGVSMAATGGTERAFMLGGIGQDNLVGGSNDDLIVGGTGADALAGGNGSDILIGAADNDTLTGNAGADHLEGGSGADTYLIASGDGNDILLDTDGQGSIVYNGTALTGGTRISGNYWSGANGVSYTLLAMDGSQDLLIDTGTDRLTVKDFTSGELGISLPGGTPPPTGQTATGFNIYGDLTPYQMPWDYYLWLAYPTWPYLFDVNGNLVHTTVPMPYFADKIFDSAGDDNIYAGHGLNVIYATNGGNNYIESGANDDYILGGNGRDVVFSGGMSDTIDVAGGNDIVYGADGGDVAEGGAGNDYLVGGNGADALHGGEGDDQVYGSDPMGWQEAVAENDTGVSGQGELLAGAGGNDTVIGSQTDDALLGGTGQDQLAGRAGDDILLGDSGLDFAVPPLAEFDTIIATTNWPIGTTGNFHSPYTTAPMLNLQFQKIDHGVGAVNRFEVKLSSAANPEAPRDNWAVAPVSGGNDQLYGGAGNDWLFGEFGDDTGGSWQGGVANNAEWKLVA